MILFIINKTFIMGNKKNKKNSFLKDIKKLSEPHNLIKPVQNIMPLYEDQDYLKFLQQLIQIEIDSNSNPQVVYRFLAQHQNKLD